MPLSQALSAIFCVIGATRSAQPSPDISGPAVAVSPVGETHSPSQRMLHGKKRGMCPVPVEKGLRLLDSVEEPRRGLAALMPDCVIRPVATPFDSSEGQSITRPSHHFRPSHLHSARLRGFLLTIYPNRPKEENESVVFLGLFEHFFFAEEPIS